VNVHLAPADLIAATGAQVVDITIPEQPAPEAAAPESHAAPESQAAPDASAG